MKKLLLVLVCVFALASLVGCKESNEEKEYKLGMGVVVSTASSKNAKLAQIDATVAAVVVEGGKIVACRLDAVQNKITVTAEGGVTVPTEFKTKMELGDDYNMAKRGQELKLDWNKDGVVKEWYYQAKAFEAHVVGKTAQEVKDMPTKTVEDYVISAEDSLLAAGCTIQITDFKAAVAKACEDAQGTTFKTSETFTLGVAATSFDEESKSATGSAAGAVQVYSDFAASVVVGGKIAASLNDAIQPKFAISATGEVTASFTATKRELKEDYNMAERGQSMDWNKDGVVKEWYLQSFEFSKHVVGKTAQEVLDMPTKTVEDYVISAEDSLLTAGCTIQITSIKAVVAKSVNNAR